MMPAGSHYENRSENQAGIREPPNSGTNQCWAVIENYEQTPNDNQGVFLDSKPWFSKKSKTQAWDITMVLKFSKKKSIDWHMKAKSLLIL
jgi:hypothetical protein